ncbi:hypothetical protein Q9R08_12320 [Microbacterium sp. QXD-8]|uniref:UDP-3-O-(3-hydroxymyristoyl)glucosamine N-acyltransferase n=1 Tax=Microbacterium psychrotolerans TaxID=3068321 RepID=A0ABU0Z2F4_9MICO|nr:hypothetical protein [Microbacterium sp. QXD-8]MDQ7878766.1 hypothetical protein [Microbacterium sp. QXD-8]
MITQEDLSRATGWRGDAEFSVSTLDLAGNNPGSAILGFLDDGRFLPGAARNPALSAVLVSEQLEVEARRRLGRDITIVVVDDPRWHFYTLHNEIALAGPLENEPTVVHPDAVIHPGAFIDGVGVHIAARAVVEPNATVLRSARIGEGAVVRAGSVIGTPGFEHKRTSRGILSVTHDGETRIGARTEVGSLTTVARGFARRHTELGADCRIDSNVMIAHGSHLGDRVFVAGGTVISGSTDIGDDVWIGPGATLIDRVKVGVGARVAIGSVVFTKVAPGARVAGNPARASRASNPRPRSIENPDD